MYREVRNFVSLFNFFTCGALYTVASEIAEVRDVCLNFLPLVVWYSALNDVIAHGGVGRCRMVCASLVSML